MVELRNTRTIMLPGKTDRLAIGLIRPVKPELLSILNKAIRSISGETRDEIVARNTALSGQEHTLETFLYTYPTLVVAILVALVLVMVLIGVLRARHTRQLFRTKYTDEVTGALNLQGFRRTGARLLQSGRRYAITYESIRNLQYINDHYGYQAGDDILRRVARMMEKDINSETEAFCRVTGGVFVALRTYTDREAFLRRLDDFHDSLCEVAPENEPTNPIRIASGIYFAHEDDAAMDIFGMMDRASAAHQQIAGSAEQDCIIYEESFYNRILRNQEIESRMEAALDNGEFIVFLQPKFSLNTMRPAAAEALVRWRSVDGLIPPDEFIPLFERNGFVSQLDTYMFEQTCKLMRRWLDHRMPVVPVSVNVSRVLLRQHGFVQRYIDIKKKYAIPDHLLELEVTESALLEDEELLYSIVSKLHKAGFRCSIDDFGKGYSSLTMLKNLPVDTLKLDAQFFKKGVDDMRDDTVVRSVINIASSLGMMTVAEGIESKEQVTFLKNMGCDMVQGYVFSRPLDASSFEAYLHRKLIDGEDPYLQ